MNSKTDQLDLAMAFEFGDDRPILPNEAVLESGEFPGSQALTPSRAVVPLPNIPAILDPDD